MVQKRIGKIIQFILVVLENPEITKFKLVTIQKHNILNQW